MKKSPFYKKGSESKMGKGCADTSQGCIRKDGSGFKILKNKNKFYMIYILKIHIKLI